MTTFRVWAPLAHAVALEVGGDRVSMVPEPGGLGWHAVDVPWAVAGTDYRFVVDGGVPLPDPRSPWQPDGVDGPSRVVDHASFPWTDGRWRGLHWPTTVLYELHVGTFSDEGTFDGAIAHLDHLVELGVTAVELLPVAQFSGARGWGYDGVDLWAPHHAYGGPDGLKRLVDACHHRGIGVILDVVYNHLGPAGNVLGQFGPYFTDRYRTPWGDAVNVDGAHSGGMRDFILDNACLWLRDHHIDGLRLDAVHAIVDGSAHHLLQELAERVESLAREVGRPLVLIAESDLNDPRIVQRPEVGGYGLDATWSDEWHHALHAVLTGEVNGYYEDFGTIELLAKAVRQSYVYDGTWSAHRHRRHGRPPTGLPAWRLLAYAQNHDQVGNRAVGERLSALVGLGRCKIAAALVATSPFVPMLFQGEEWGASAPFLYFTDHQDPALGQAVSDGRRREFSYFGWKPDDVPDPQDRATFERSKLDWAELERPPHAELLAWHRALLNLRRQVADLGPGGTIGEVRTEHDEGERWLVVRRGPVVVACNLGTDERRIHVSGRLLLASEPSVVVIDGAVVLPADSVAIVVDG